MSTYSSRAPEYFPRLSYLAQMKHVDLFIVDDTLQYSRQSFQNRTRIRNPTGRQWLTVPLMGKQHGFKICEVRVDPDAPWAGKHKRALEYNYRTTPYFEFYEDRFLQFFAQPWELLGDVTWRSIQLVHECLGLTTRLLRASKLDPAQIPTFRRVVSAETALSFQAGDATDFSVFDYEEPTYRQNFEGFVPGMSVLDLLFNYGPEALSFL